MVAVLQFVMIACFGGDLVLISLKLLNIIVYWSLIFVCEIF
jgi:hypothetical protein